MVVSIEDRLKDTTEYMVFIKRRKHRRHQQNGLAERMNRTLTERVTAILSHAKLPNQFWAEALMNVVYVLNLSPCVPLKGDIPEKV